MATVTTPEALLTADEFGRRPDPGYPEELVRGRIIAMPPPKPRHGQICCQAAYLLRRYLDDNEVGQVMSNDSGVITERGPDTVRGADVVFYCYARVPKGPLPDQYLDVSPDLVVEVLSPSDRWSKVLARVAEYLEAGVSVVVVLDDERRSAQVFGADGTTRELGPDDDLTLPDPLSGFRVAVRRFFE
jgi:Uma2 family endonuclease